MTQDYSNARFAGDRPASECCEEETCPQGCECPHCGENRIDWLVWLDDYETVRCATCGHEYQPNADPIPEGITAQVIAFERMGERYAAQCAKGQEVA